MSTIDSLKLASQQTSIYLGLLILIPGMIGAILNVIVFTSLNTFRQTICAFYLTFASIIGMGEMMILLFLRILSDGFSINPRTIPWFCKIHYFIGNWCLSVWLTIVCLATIDQFLSMSKYRHFSTKRLAYRFIFITCIFWLVHGIPMLIYWDVTPSGVCTIVNPTYVVYFSRFAFPVLYGCLPIALMITFSLLAYHRARTLSSQQLNIVRRSHDRQLTAMILVYVTYTVIVMIPFTTFYIYSFNVYTTSAEQRAFNAFMITITILIEYSMFAVSNLYIC